ncbi:MFS transporter [Saccharibacillus sp. JS10]|uniref:MFS transporter n=1 Tax=Saccharibacillus sp. JS10 TaxID=2950552 RepID=UPI00210941C3|nr:MFS transporter [Saccharibacillus sp. JS10]MCQ4088031.1 MFS transporter [Saccharibacillus sp. JS10]
MKTESEKKTVKRSSLLRNPVFGRLFAAYGTSVFGNWFDVIAIQVLIGYRWQSTPLEIALIPIGMALPGILLGSLAGAAVDRFHPLKLMKISHLLTAWITIVILFAPNIYVLLPLLSLRASLELFIIPAQQTLTKSIVEENRLVDASSLNGLIAQLSRVIGPLAGAGVLALGSPQLCILINAIARGIAYMILNTVPRPSLPTFVQQSPASSPTSQAKTSLRQELWEGWKFVIRTRIVLHLLMFALCGMLIIQTIDFQFVSLFRDLAPRNETAIGWLLAASGISAGVIAVANMRIEALRQCRYAFKLGSGYALIGLSIWLLSLLSADYSIIELIAIGLLLGAGNGLFVITFSYALQKETPAEMTGRVFGIQNTMFSIVMIAAPLLGGLFIQKFGASEIFNISGLLIFTLGLIGLTIGPYLWKYQTSISEH